MKRSKPLKAETDLPHEAEKRYFFHECHLIRRDKLGGKVLWDRFSPGEAGRRRETVSTKTGRPSLKILSHGVWSDGHSWERARI